MAVTLPLVTAIVPVYNHERYVVDSLQSIIRQTYPNIELIVINDGSRDHSDEMVLSVAEECRKRFVHFEYISRENRGVSASLNQALEMAHGKYFSGLASDDIILPDKFASLVEALEPTDDLCAGAFGNATFIDEQGRQIYVDRSEKPYLTPSSETYSNFLDFHTRDKNFNYRSEFAAYRTLLPGSYLPAMSSMLKTAMLKEAGGWTPGNPIEDWEMWLKLSKRHKLLFVDKTVALYRIHGQNSFLVSRPSHLRASVMLIAREKEYCFQNGLEREWKDLFYGILYWVTVHHEGNPSQRFEQWRYLQLSDVAPLAAFLGKAAVKRFRS